MIKNISMYDFERAFVDMNRADQFTYEGKKALFEYLPGKLLSNCPVIDNPLELPKDHGGELVFMETGKGHCIYLTSGIK